jgi:hypothetical protein
VATSGDEEKKPSGMAATFTARYDLMLDKLSAPFVNSSLIGPQTGQAAEGFTNRWLFVPPAMAAHLCIGAPVRAAPARRSSTHANWLSMTVIARRALELWVFPNRTVGLVRALWHAR